MPIPSINTIRVEVAGVCHYVLPVESPRAGECRPAIIVRLNGTVNDAPSLVSLVVFMDGPRDMPELVTLPSVQGRVVPGVWVPDVEYGSGGGRGTWHWPETGGH